MTLPSLGVQTPIGVTVPVRLAIGGVDGIVHVLRSLLAEADLIVAVDGYPSLGDLTPDAQRRVAVPGD